ncbi:MAG: ribokinase [Candidatus Bipolaricaulota bacterium]|nr:ribokinase [Candidatus Bipolaricaulota bacterium]
MIAVLGSANMDLVTEVARIPRPGETVAGESLRYYPGGKGANQAIAAARLGSAVAFFGKVGRDPFGDRLIQGLRADGVDVSAVARVEEFPTGTASIWVERTGENAIACVPGANGAVDAAYAARIFDRIAVADVLLLQFEIPLATIAFVLERLPKERPIVILDPAPAQSLSGLPLDRIDILTPNRTELSILTGIDGLEPAARRLLSLGVRGVVCKAGDQGAYWIGETTTHVPTMAVEVVDSTAAGDAFNGALGCAVTERSILEAIRFANAAGALATTKHGAQPSLPRRSEVDRLLAAVPSRPVGSPRSRG